MDRKKKIEYVLGSICLIPILLGKYYDNNTLIVVGAIPLFVYIGVLIFNVILAMDSTPKFLQGKITNIKTRRNKLIWKDFDLILKDGTSKQFSIPEVEFPSNILENDNIEVSYKKSGFIGYTYVTKMKLLIT